MPPDDVRGTVTTLVQANPRPICCTCSGLLLMWWTAPAPGDESP